MRLPLRLAGAAVAAMLLSSCWWGGPPFYTGNPADPGPLKPGRYATETVGAPDQSGKTVVETGITRVVWRRDGSVWWSGPRKANMAMTFIAARLDVPGRDLWVIQDRFGKPQQGEQDLRAYGLIDVRPDGLWMMPMIDCDSTVDIVRAAGGTVTGGMTIGSGDAVDAVNSSDAENGTPDMVAGLQEGKRTGQSCEFADRASLERALRAYVAATPDFPVHVRLKRIGD